MQHDRKRLSRLFINAAVLATAAIALVVLLSTFFHASPLDKAMHYYAEINHLIQRLVAVCLLFIVWKLHRRQRIAWLLAILLLLANLFSHFFLHRGFVSTLLVTAEVFVLAVLLVYYKSFSRPSGKSSVKRGLLMGGLALGAVVANAALAYYNLKVHEGIPASFLQSLATSWQMLLGAGGHTTSPNFERFIFIFSWGCIGLGLMLILRPAAHKAFRSKRELEQARELVKKHGQNPGSYLALEEDKLLFFGTTTEGVVAYGLVNDVVVVDGDPICSPENFTRFTAEFMGFCTQHDYPFVFLGTTPTFLDNYTQLGFGHIKCGEEPRFHLPEFTLAGGKMAKMRANVNHAANAGLTTHEYQPLLGRDAAIEAGINGVSTDWLGTKKSGQLGFTVGDVNLDNPMDRRYFYAKDATGNIVAFNVYLPFAAMTGYMADVTRRKPDAPGGVTEKIMAEAFETFHKEGVEWASMGLSPLANVLEGEGSNDDATAKLLALIYEKGNRFYGFKDLHRAKEKYSPTAWVPGYFVTSTKHLTPQMAWAIIAIQNPQGMGDYIKGFFHSKGIKEGKADGGN